MSKGRIFLPLALDNMLFVCMPGNILKVEHAGVDGGGRRVVTYVSIDVVYGLFL